MPTLREFFATEAGELLVELGKAVQRLDGGSGDAAELQKHTRGLRGSAQMAREDRVYRAAVGLEAAARSLAAGALGWSEDLSARVRRTLEDVAALVRGGETDDAADARVRRTLDRWKEIGVDMPQAGPVAQGAEQVSEASHQFRQFAAHEVAGIVAEMDVSLETLVAEPRNRDPLKAILRRMRALLGAARLDEISVVAEALRATEDVTRIIAKLNAPVKEEWLAVFRAARDVLRMALGSLQKAEIPGPSHALSKLRVLRQELTDRYGGGEQAGGTYTPPTPAPPSPSPSSVTASPETDQPVSIESLEYRGEKALQRALELQPQLAALVAANPAARESLDEVFDLIRLGIS